MPELVPGDGILTSLGTEAEDLFDSDAPPSKKEEDEILKKIIDEYEVEKIKIQWMKKEQFMKVFIFSMVGTANCLIML